RAPCGGAAAGTARDRRLRRSPRDPARCGAARAREDCPSRPALLAGHARPRWMSLLSEVLRVLEREKTQTALIGAAALAVRGVSRSTADTALLCVDTAILRKEVWAGLEAPGREVRILKGDPEDPLAGSVR